MLAFFCRTRLRVPRNYDAIFTSQQFWTSQNAVLVRSCSSSVCENAPEKSFTVSYLINTCGLSSDDAVSASKKVSFKSPEKPDAVLKILREYGFKDADHIPRIVTKCPHYLVSSPSNILPKLEFLSSIGVPLPILAKKLSADPTVLRSSLKNSIIPSYNYLKTLLQSDKRVVQVFRFSPRYLVWSWAKRFSSNVSILTERGIPLSSMAGLVTRQPNVLLMNRDILAVHVNRAVEMGFDASRSTFYHAVHVFVSFSESSLKRKMEVYRKCGWLESEIVAAFLKHPNCMTYSEEKITGTMDFLVDELGCKPAAIAQCPVVLGYSLEKRIKPRGLVSKVLYDKGLKNVAISTLLTISEEKFLKKYIDGYVNDIPELLDVYLGKVKSSHHSPVK